METTQTNGHGENGGGNQGGDFSYRDTTASFLITTEELKAAFERVRQKQKYISNRIQRFKFDIEKSLSDIQTTTETMTNTFLSTFSSTNGRKRTFLDVNKRIDFGDIEKEYVKLIYDQFEVFGSDHADCLMTLSDLKEKTITKHGGSYGFSIPRFLQKLYAMVEKEEINDLISWKLPNRESFVIWDINKFAAHVLPMYFKHTNFSSFNWQLNIYCFKKVSREKHEYANDWFRGGRYDLLVNIRRRSKSLSLTRSPISCSTSDLEMFTDRLKTIQQEQDNKIMWLSNYEEQVKRSICEFKEAVKNMANIVDKMIEKNTEKLGNFNFKKAKLDIKGHGKKQDSQVNEPRDNEASRENNNSDTLSIIQEPVFDFVVLEQLLMEDLV